MSNEAKFIEGLIVKAPHERAPDYVKAKLSIKREELLAWLQAQPGEWINADVKVSQGGKWYCQVDDWKAGAERGHRQTGGSREARQTTQQSAEEDFDDLPF